ncbi:MAG: shikimate kinase [Bacillota bacterium]|nr:shikimate kinase [Bacillota bacterium]
MIHGFLSEKGSFNTLVNLYTSLGCKNYQSFTIPNDQLSSFLEKKEFDGITLSRSFQKEAYYLCDQVDDKARLCKMVNCIRNENGILYGTNTDFDGVFYTFKKKNVSLKGKIVLIVGNGQVAKVVKAVCYSLGAKIVKNINQKRTIGTIGYKEAYSNYKDADIIINTIFIGKKNTDLKSPIDISAFPNLSFVMDMAYDPLLPRLLIDAKEANIAYANGLKAFLYTHYCSMEFFQFPMKDFDLDALETKIIRKKCNIAFIGMSSAGKTCMGRRLHNRLQKKWVDIDILLVKEEKKTIPTIFEESSESGFRELETKYIKEVSFSTNTLISCGGGVVTRDINMKCLSQNGLIIHLNRPLEFLKRKDTRRPMLKNNSIDELYKLRFPLYMHYADFTIDTENSIEDACAKIEDLLSKDETYNKFK